jgi:hypothetical protein
MVETELISQKNVDDYIQYVEEFTGLDKAVLIYLSIREWVIKHGNRDLKERAGVDNKMFVGTMIDLDDAIRY